jgi:hypothetical protein
VKATQRDLTRDVIQSERLILFFLQSKLHLDFVLSWSSGEAARSIRFSSDAYEETTTTEEA